MGQQVTKEQGSTTSGPHHGSSSSSSAQAHLQFGSGPSFLAPPPPKPLPSHLSDKVKVDNGGLVPHGVYTGPQDYDQRFVREAIVDRRMAPFCKGSDDENEFVSEMFNSECPICFLYYPSPLNFSRCCHQPICSECFVAMKRADPNHTNPPSSEARACPFCVEPEFGVIYTPPSKLEEQAGDSAVNDATDAANFAEVAIGTGGVGGGRGQQRKKVLPADNPSVITVDQIRPDWQMKLAQAQAAIARRANRRVIMQQVGDRLIPIGISSSRAGADLAAAADSGRVNLNGPGGSIILQDGQLWPGAGAIGSGSGSTSSRRRGRSSRSDSPNTEIARFMRMSSGEEMEEIMLMEAMRLSLLDHEEQQRKEAEEAKKRQEQQQSEAAAGPSNSPVGQASGSSPRSSSSGEGASASASPQSASPALAPPAPFDVQRLGLSSGLMSELSELIEGGPPPSTNGTTSSNNRETSPSAGESIMSSPNRPVRTSIPAPVPVPESLGNLGAAWNESSTAEEESSSSGKHPVQVSTRNASSHTTPFESSSVPQFSRTKNPRNPFRRSMGESS